MVTTPYYTGQDFGPKEGMAYTAVMPQEGFKYVYDQEGTRYSIPTTFNVSSGGGYTSLYKPDPTTEEQEAGIQATSVYQGSPYALANVPEFEGIQYATPDYNRYQDLYSLYMGGGFDASQPDFVPPAAPPGGEDSGGGGVGTGGGTGITTGVNTPEQQRLIDAGIGVQIAPGQPVVAPGEIPVTQAEIDAYNQIPVTPVGGQPIDPTGMLPQISTRPDLGEVTADDYGTPTYVAGTAPLEDAGAGMGDMYATDYQGEPYIEDDLMDYDEHYDMDMETMGPYEKAAEDAWKNKEIRKTPAGDMIVDTVTGQIEKAIADFPPSDQVNLSKVDSSMPPMLDPTGQMGASNYQAPQITDFPEQVDFDQDFIDAKDYSAPGTLSDPMEKDFVTEEDMANPNNLLTKLGLPADFDIKRAAVEAGLNLAIGMPITILARLLPGGGIHPSTNLARNIGLLEGSNTTTQDKYGISTQTSFNPIKSTKNYTDYNVERVEQLEDRMEKSKTKYIEKHGSLNAKNEYNKTWAEMNQRNLRELDDRKEYLTVSGYGGDVEGDQPGMTIAEQIALQDRVKAVGDFDDRADAKRLANLTGDLDIDKQATIPLGKEDRDIEIKDISKPDWLIESQRKSKENYDQWLEEQKLKDKIAEEVGDFDDLDIIDRGGGDDLNFEPPSAPTTLKDMREQMIVDRGGDPNQDDRPVTTTTKPGTLRTSTYDTEEEDFRDVGGDSPSDSPGGKSIVCTAMYQTTGLEDWKKAMKIWYIYQKKYLTIQHQEGYHKLFKPFVKGMYKNKIIKTIGAHIAKHRTQHLKHVMFNSKPSLLGKIYNKILEPICYWVGKHVKR